ncbi:MAG: membrane dipeptidase [Kangiellaceae bacterium]|nr:membrane dipeptidase [Kangiellaceae bacterium]
MKKTIITLLISAALGTLVACQDDDSKVSVQSETQAQSVNQADVKKEATTEIDYVKEAQQISKKYVIADLHVDVPYRLEEQLNDGHEHDDVSQATQSGDFDYPRAKSGGLDAPFMSIYIPASIEQENGLDGSSKAMADKLIGLVENIVAEAPEKYALAYSSDDVIDNFNKGLISLPMGMENGSPLEGNLDNLQYFYDKGIRYITLSHSLSNHISDSSYDEARPADGLTDFGKQVVAEMNRLGIMVDVSHISDEAFYDVMEITSAPVIASHSSARHFTPGFERNMSDEMIKKLADNGGVIFINFGSTFVSQTSIENYNAYKEARAKFVEESGIELDDPKIAEFTKTYRAQTPFEFADLDVVLDHFDHVVKLVGIDHVGIGSDYDGVGDSLPTGLKDVATYPNLITGLLKRGYSEQDIEKILSGNLFRVWKQAEQISQQ